MNKFGVGSIASYQDFDQVGEGTYGYVYKAKRKSDNETVALKKLIIHRDTSGFPLCAIREIKFLKSLQHENIVRLLDIASSKGCEYVEKNIKVDSNRSEERNEQENNKKKDPVQEYCAKEMKIAASIYLVFEFVEHDLGGLIDARYRFSAKAIKSIAKQLFEVIDFLSERRILHRDIKSSNILITNHHVVKLADFGLARSTIGADGRENKLDLTNNVITMWYKPPELLLGAVKYSTAVDVWSAACVVAELELGRPLFPGKTEVEQADLVFKAIGTPSEDEWPGLTALPCYEQIFKSLTTKYSSNMKSTFSNKLSELMLNLLERILVADPGKRGTAKVALTNKYFYSPPLPPVYPQEMEPINVAAGISYHEYKTKQLRRQKDSEAKIEIKSAEADDPSIDSSINSKVVVNEQASTNLNNPFTYGVDLSRTAQIPRPPVFKPPIPPQSYYPQHQAPIQAPPRMQGLSRQDNFNSSTTIARPTESTFNYGDKDGRNFYGNRPDLYPSYQQYGRDQYNYHQKKNYPPSQYSGHKRGRQ